MKYSTILGTLAALLLLQAGIILLSRQGDDQFAKFKPTEPLVKISTDSVEKIEIKDGAGGSLVLAKKNNSWVLPVQNDFPAAATKVKAVLEKVGEVRRSYPVARTKVAWKQLKVGETNFERMVTFKSESGEEVIYLGTSPGFKKVHARSAADDATYSVLLGIFDFSADSNDWLEREILEVDPESIDRVRLEDLELVKNEDSKLVPAELQEGEEPQHKEIERTIAQLARLRFLSVVPEEDVPAGEEVLKASLKYDGDKERQYVFIEDKADEKSTFYLEVSDLPFRFTVSEGPVNILREATREDFVKKNEKELSDGKGSEDSTSTVPENETIDSISDNEGVSANL